MNATTEREQDAVILTGGRRLRSAGIHLGHWKFDEYVDAAVREFDRLTAERDAARKELAEKVDRLTNLAYANIQLDRDHVSVGSSEDDAMALTWGAAGRELLAALGIESEASE